MKVVIAAGGTGGHLYPGLSIAERLREQGVETIFLISQKEKEGEILQKQGFRFKRLDVCGWQRRLFSLQTIEFVSKTLKGILDTIEYLEDFKPDIVIGMGGFVCVSPVIAAWCMRVPILLHEQNAIPGKANRLLSRFVDKIAISFSQSLKYFKKDKAILTGNPLRKGIGQITRDEGRMTFNLSSNKFTLFIFGGSRGASQINMAMAEALKYLDKQTEDLQIIWATGEDDYLRIKEISDTVNLNIIVTPYIFEMTKAYAISDLAICRAGATTITEIIACNLPVILIPYPYATDDHQSANAQVLEEAGVAVVLKDTQVSGDRLADLILKMKDDKVSLEEMRKRYENIKTQDAAERVVTLIYGLVT